LNITSDGSDYTAGTIMVNGVVTTGFTHTTGNNYTVTYTVASGNTNRSAGNVPASVILTDTAGNSNSAYTTVTANTLRINGQISNSATQIFPSFSSDGTFTTDVVFNCVTGSGDLVMYSVSDADNTYNFMNQTSGVFCPGGHQTYVSSGQKFSSFSGYSLPVTPIVGWYYIVISLNGTQNCTHALGISCTPNAPDTFLRLHRNASDVWSDLDN